MKEMNHREVQQCLLEMLKWFDGYAKDHGFIYYLSGGTLLGAVRHKGFIPWDDDVDLMMPRPDYDRMIAEYRNDGRYQFICCERDPDYRTPFGRIWDTKTIWIFERLKDKEFGAFLDVFPIDGYPSDAWITKLYACSLKIKRFFINQANRNYFMEGEKYQGVKKLLKPLIRKDGNYYCRKLNTYARKRPYDGSEYVGVTTTTVHIFRERNPRSIFLETLYLPFEDTKLPAPGGYDVYLTHLYGDYMQLPPADKQVSEHDYKLFWRDEE